MADHALATVSNPTSALTDFTLIVDLSDMPASWWSAVNTSDGTRGRVYKGDGTTRLACDWIDFDDTAETGFLRVLWSGTLASTGTQQLWIEPPVSGNATVGATDTYGSDNAYNSGWWGYWTLDEDPSGTAPQIIDRTSNGHDLTSEGSMTSGDSVTGQIGSAIETDGSNDGLTVTATPPSDWPVTIMAWLSSDVTDDNPVVSFANSSSSNELFGVSLNDSQQINLFIYDGSGRYDEWVAGTGSAGLNHVAGVFVGDAQRYGYLNGTEVIDSTQGDQGYPTGLDTVGIGIIPRSSQLEKEGIHDEAQVHSVARSAAWVEHEYDQTNDNATFWGTWSWETGGASTDALTATDLVAAAPTLDSPTIGQEHALAATDLVGSTPTLDSPTIGQVHALAADNLSAAAPVLGSPTAGQSHVLTATNLVSGTPALGSPTIGQVHALAAADLDTSVPVLGTPIIGQVHALAATDLVSGVPVLGSPTIAEETTTDNLTASDLVASAPVLGSPTIGQVHVLTATDLLGGVSLDTPTIGQVHVLTATDLVSGAPVLGNPSLSIPTGTWIWVKYADGTMIARTTYSIPNYTLSSVGGLYVSGEITVSLPVVFFDTEYNVFCTVKTTTGYTWAGQAEPVDTGSFKARIYTPVNDDTVSVQLSIMVIGDWKSV